MKRSLTTVMLLSLFTIVAHAHADDWVVTLNGNIAEIAYGSGGEYPQYGVLHLSSSYFRLIPDRESGWGTSVILSPSYWSGGAYFQGAQITSIDWITDQGNLVLYVNGQTAGGLGYIGAVMISPPANGMIQAYVDISVVGSAVLDTLPGESFKPVMLSSMHISDTIWDCKTALAGFSRYAIPTEGWIVSLTKGARVFGLTGGDSQWKSNAPSVLIRMHSPNSLVVTGWVTDSTDPNDDNVGFWCASDTVLNAWQYTLVAFTSRIQ